MSEEGAGPGADAGGDRGPEEEGERSPETAGRGGDEDAPPSEARETGPGGTADARGDAHPTSDSGTPASGDPDARGPGVGAGALQAVQAQGEEASPDEGSLPDDVRTYDRFTKVDRASYDRVNEFLRERTYVTAREWAIARLCADFRTATGVEMTKIGEHLPELVPFMTDTYSPQAVNQARSAFERKVQMAGATFLYGAMSGFFTADELDELMYEVTEVAKFLLEVEGVELAVEEELEAEDRISSVMREVRRASEELRYDEVACPHCGGEFRPDVGED